MLHLFNCRRKIANSQNNNNYNDIEQIIEKGMLSKVVIILDGGFFDHPLLYQEASWCISNMAGGKHEHVEALVSAGVVGSMVRLFIAEQNYSIIDNVKI